MSNILIGKTVTAIYLADDKKAIKFEIADGEPVIAKTDGDCCSDSWVEHTENPDNAVGSPILSVEDVDMPDLPKEEEFGDLTQCYGCKIKTAKGEFFLEYRNSSNGYYGGNLWWPGTEYSHFYGGVRKQNVSSEQWVKIA